jgi:hypothetical protein
MIAGHRTTADKRLGAGTVLLGAALRGNEGVIIDASGTYAG